MPDGKPKLERPRRVLEPLDRMNEPPRPPLRPLEIVYCVLLGSVWVICLIQAIGLAFFDHAIFDAEPLWGARPRPRMPTTRSSAVFLLLLVVLIISVAAFIWWSKRRRLARANEGRAKRAAAVSSRGFED
jgi:hypothetical protein